MLSTKNLPLKQGKTKKLAAKYIGPFKIIEKYAQGNAYKLLLPSELKGLHPTFHICLLKRCHLSEEECHKPSLSSYKLAKNNFKIEKIISHVGYPGRRKFLVKFKFMDDSENQWKDERELNKYHDLIRQYEIEYARGRAPN